MRLEETLQQMQPEDVDDVRYHLDLYAKESNKKNAKELWKCMTHIKRTYPMEIYSPILHIYTELVNLNNDE